MVRKELISLLENNIILFSKLSDRINRAQIDFGPYSRTQVQLLIRLYLSGRTRLKDLATREFVPASNLCAAFRKMEGDGIVLRAVDENDRRNTWYSVTDKGAKLATQFINMFHNVMATLFKDIDKADEDKLIESFKTMNAILVKMGNKNA